MCGPLCNLVRDGRRVPWVVILVSLRRCRLNRLVGQGRRLWGRIRCLLRLSPRGRITVLVPLVLICRGRMWRLGRRR